MDINIYTRPIFSFELKRSTLILLITLSKHHYDGRCKAASAEASINAKTTNGFLTIWDSRFIDYDKPGIYYLESANIVNVKIDELDTLLKICEPINWTGIITLQKDKDIITNFVDDIKKAVDVAHKNYHKWKATYISNHVD